MNVGGSSRRALVAGAGIAASGRVDRARQRDLVRRGYDAISHAYRDDQGRSNPLSGEDVTRYAGWVEELASLIPAGSRVLDLGCGAGVPGTKLLAEGGFEVVGVDISQVQTDRARRLVPGATFVTADMAAWDCESNSFDAVVSFYALIHLPLDDQPELLGRIRRWLRPDGMFLGIVGQDRWTGVQDYLGAPMFWDHADVATYLDWLKRAKLQPVWDRYVPEGEVGHVLVLARAV